MNNIIKKISAMAMAFTLLGAGTTIVKNNPKLNNTLTASAAATCPNHAAGTKIEWGAWEFYDYTYSYVPAGNYYLKTGVTLKRNKYRRCNICGRNLEILATEYKDVCMWDYIRGKY